jgi:WD40 repeat protein
MPINLDLLKAFAGHEREVNAIAFSRDDSQLASASADHAVRVWSTGTYQMLRTLEHGGGVTGVAFAPSGRMVASAGRDHEARIWNVENGKLLATLGSQEQSPLTVAFTNDGLRLVIGGADGLVRIFNLRDKTSEGSVRAHAGPVRTLRLSSLGDRLLSSGGDGVARVWQMQAKEKPVELKGHNDELLYATFSPDDRFIATAGKDGAVRLWESESGRQLYSFKAHEGAANSVNFSPDAMYLLSAGADKALRFWHAESGRFVSEAIGEGNIGEAIFSHGGDRIASCAGDGTVKIWRSAEAKVATSERAPAGEPATHHSGTGQQPVRPEPARVSSAKVNGQADKHALHEILSRAVHAEASDIHVPSGADILFRKDGSLEKLDEPHRTPAEIETMLLAVLTSTSVMRSAGLQGSEQTSAASTGELTGASE